MVVFFSSETQDNQIVYSLDYTQETDSFFISHKNFCKRSMSEWHDLEGETFFLESGRENIGPKTGSQIRNENSLN